jgi:hypothetical protein
VCVAPRELTSILIGHRTILRILLLSRPRFRMNPKINAISVILMAGVTLLGLMNMFAACGVVLLIFFAKFIIDTPRLFFG